MKNYIRITLDIEKEAHDKLRKIQSDLLREENKSISFSFVANHVIKRGLKK